MNREERIFIETYGCQMNVYDSAAIGGILDEAGFRRTDRLEEATTVLLNTCSVRELAEHKVISRIGELRSLGRRGLLPVRRIGICGCMAERMAGKLIKGTNRPDLVVGVDRYDLLPEMLHGLDDASGAARVAVGHLENMHYVAPPLAMPTNNSHLVSIHKGCDYKCTYCIVPATRGPQREKTPDVILEEIRTIVSAGGAEVTLLGQNVSAWRHDDRDFAWLLETIAAETDIPRIRFLTGHPRDMHPHLIETIAAQPRVCPWLHVPAQSGSDRVLKRMKRLYGAREYLDMVELSRRLIPDVTFSGDFIVGFPGETEEDFQATLELVRGVRYDQTFNFKYSERPDTPASRLEDDVPETVKKERLGILLDLQEDIWEDIAASCTGEIWTAFCEGPARRPEGMLKFRTANNRKVLAADDTIRPGETRRLRIDGHHLTTFTGTIIPDER